MNQDSTVGLGRDAVPTTPARPLRIAHCGDAHLGVTTHSGNRRDEAGVNVRTADVAARWFDFCRYAAHNADLVLFSGDAFDSARPEPAALRLLAEGLKYLSSQMVPVVMITGNHDVPGNGASHALSVINTLSPARLWVVDRPCVLHLPVYPDLDVAVACLPWAGKGWANQFTAGASLEDRDALVGAFLEQTIDDLAKQTREVGAAYSVLLAHITVAEAQAEATMMMGRDVALPLSAFRKHADTFGYVALGHIHRFQTWPAAPGLDGPAWAAYPGGLDRIRFLDTDQHKGWLSVVMEDNAVSELAVVSGVETAPRRFVAVEVDCLAEPDPVAACLAAIAARGDLSDAIVRLTVRIKDVDEARLNDARIQRALSGALHCAPIVKDVERTERRMRLGGASTIAAMTPAELLALYFKQQEHLSPADRAMLVGVGTSLMAEVDRGGG